MNILKELKKLTTKESKYKTGIITNVQGDLFEVSSNYGNILKVTGFGFRVGDTVLIENGKIIARVSSVINRYAVP